MNSLKTSDWREDLEHSRDLNSKEKTYIAFLVNWFESWRLTKGLGLDRVIAARFWREAVCCKERLSWQKDQWAEGMRWYLNWVKLCEKRGEDPKGLPERVRKAVDHVGSRRGLAYRTRQSYGGWVARYGASAPNHLKSWISPCLF